MDMVDKMIGMCEKHNMNMTVCGCLSKPLREGNKKGGLNKPPTTPKPAPPKGQKPQKKDTVNTCFVCDKEIPPGPSFCSEECENTDPKESTVWPTTDQLIDLDGTAVYIL